MIETALINLFETNSYSAPVFISEIPLDQSLPAILLSLESSTRTTPKSSPGIKQDRFELGCYAETQLEAANISNSIFHLIQGYKGDLNGINITLARVINIYDYNESQSSSFARVFTLIVNYTES